DRFVGPRPACSVEEQPLGLGERVLQRLSSEPPFGFDPSPLGLRQASGVLILLEDGLDRSPAHEGVQRERPVAHLGDGRPPAHGAGSPNARRRKSSSTRSSATESSSIPPMCDELGSSTRSCWYPFARSAAESCNVFATKTLSSARPCISRSDRCGDAVEAYVTSELRA